MNHTLPVWRRGLLLASLCLGATALVAQTATPVKNPTFADADGDGTPDGWNPYPPANGDTLVLAPAPGGGLVFKDNDKNNGLGLEQWIPVQEGQRYTASAEATGTGGISLTLIFAPKKPNKPGDLKSIQLSEKSVRIAPGKTGEVVAVAPAGAKWMKLWLYCPKIGIADLVIKKVALSSDTPPAAAAPATASAPDVPATPPPAPAAAAPTDTPAAPAATAPTGPVPAGNLLKNPTFADSDGDGTPDGWNPYPPGNGDTLVLSSAPGGGLAFKDNDKNNGLGLEQWVPVQEGLRYTATADATGTGVILNLIFAPKKPNKPGDLKSIQLGDKSVRLAAGKPNELVAVAPAGAKWVKVWFYCPKIGVADSVIRQVSVTAGAPAASPAPAAAAGSATAATVSPASAPAAPLPPGLADVIDFETGDFSQAHGTEGGNVSVITAAQGPVREGKYAFKTSVQKNQHRAEVTGPRCPPYGIARYGWSLYVPKEFDADTFFSIITQWHDWGTGRQSPPDGGPPTSISVSKGQVTLKVHYQGDDGWTTKKQYLPVCKIDDLRGQWTDWVMEANWQPPGKGGWIKLYLNGKVVVDYKGTTFYEGKDKGPYFKFGCYKGGASWKGTEEGAVLYFDSFRMALGESSTYQMVDPATYAPRPKP